MRIRARIAAAAVLAAATVPLLSGVALAHAERSVGPIDMEVGFGTEPAYVGQPNSVFIGLSDSGKPVTDLGDSLKVEVSFGDSSVALPLEPNFEVGGDGQPGDYRAWFIPSQAGAYTFHFTGTVHGTKIDESMTSGPKTFDLVQEISGATFPQVQFPTNAELATRIQQEADRVQSRLKAPTLAANDARDAASSARTVGYTGIAIGALGLIVAAVALAAAGKRA